MPVERHVLHLLEEAFPGDSLDRLLAGALGLQCVVESLVQAPTVVFAVAALEILSYTTARCVVARGCCQGTR